MQKPPRQLHPLIKIMLLLGVCFTSLFVVINATGVITTENIKQWFELAHRAKPIYIAGTVVALLFIDLFFSVPTLTITMLSGYFLGPIAGAFAALTGLLLTGTCGYLLSQKYGNWLLTRLEKDPIKRKKAKVAFQQHGAIVIVLSRALPMLPEICACLAGMTGMPFTKFILYWLLSTVPYADSRVVCGRSKHTFYTSTCALHRSRNNRGLMGNVVLHELFREEAK
ncbi:putative membrane protein YdjX (TVP38/TMEM64 family) [Alteromonadaceae bacterium 2753L.S.0a.02]|nr:putative membrane protein YdjX (TVP38/TMEM64 family) [Alteromonadaceae bacterium 2753L.S.0a.02]